MQVHILEAKNRLSQLIKYAQAGDEVVIANRGYPWHGWCRPKQLALQALRPNFRNGLKKICCSPTPNALPTRSMQELKKSATHGIDLS